MNRPSEVASFPSRSASSSITKKPPRLRKSSASPFWKSPETIASITTVCPTSGLASPLPWIALTRVGSLSSVTSSPPPPPSPEVPAVGVLGGLALLKLRISKSDALSVSTPSSIRPAPAGRKLPSGPTTGAS